MSALQSLVSGFPYMTLSFAQPPTEKERSGGFDDDKFASPWRRDGPLPPREDRFGSRGPSSRYDSNDAPDRGERMGFGSKFVPSADPPNRGGPRSERGEREPVAPTEAETNSDWRSTTRRMPPPPPPSDRPGMGSRKPSGFSNQEGPAHPADSEDSWSKGSKFSPPSEPSGARKSSFFGRGDAAPRAAEDDPSDWRSGPRRGGHTGPSNGRPNNDRSRVLSYSSFLIYTNFYPASESVPSTPNMGRRKLELLPRTASQSTATSPIGSPKASTPSGVRANPFGAAKPVDATAREREIEEKLANTRLRDKSAENPPRSSGSQERAPAEGAWRDRKGPPAGSSRPASATHSRAHSNEAANAATPPTSAGAGKKYQAPFSFTALASEIPVAEGEEEDHHGEDGHASASGLEASA